MTSPNTRPVDLDSLDPATRAVIEKFIGAEPKRRRPVPTRVGNRAKARPSFTQWRAKSERMARAEYREVTRIEQEASREERIAAEAKPRLRRIRIARRDYNAKFRCVVCAGRIFKGQEIADLWPQKKPVHTDGCAAEVLTVAVSASVSRSGEATAAGADSGVVAVLPSCAHRITRAPSASTSAAENDPTHSVNGEGPARNAGPSQ